MCWGGASSFTPNVVARSMVVGPAGAAPTATDCKADTGFEGGFNIHPFALFLALAYPSTG